MVNKARQDDAIKRLQADGEPGECPRCSGKPGEPGCGKMVHTVMDLYYGLQPGWQIGITRADADPADHAEDEWPTEQEEMEALLAAGCDIEEKVDTGVYICGIPAEWAKAAEDEMANDNAEPGKRIQECLPKEIEFKGRKWTIELPLP